MSRRRDRGNRIPDRHRPVGRQAPAPSEPAAPPDAAAPTPAEPRVDVPPELSRSGRGLVRASWIATMVLAAANLAGLVAIDTFAPLVVWLSFALFVAGCVLFFVAYAIAVGRSRTDAIGIGGLYFLAGSAPATVRRSLMGSLAVQCAVVVIVVALRPFTSLVISALAPMFGLGCAGVWAARFGRFPPRAPDSDRSPEPSGPPD